MRLSTPDSRSLPALVLALVGATALLVAQGGAPAATLFEGARLIDGTGGAPVENAAFLVEGNQITRVGRRGEVTAPAGAARVDLAGTTVIPALVDAHAHLGYINFHDTTATPAFTHENLLDNLHRAAFYGIAAVMSMGLDRGEVAYEVRGFPVPGAALLRTAGRGIAMPRGGPPAPWRIDAPYGVRTEAEARAAVREMAAKGVDLLKIWVDDRNGTVEKLPPALYRPIIDEAHQHGLRVVAHIFALEDAKGLLRAGLDGFAHGVRDRDIDDEFVQLIRQRPDAFLIPNLPERGVAADLAWMRGSVGTEEIAGITAALANMTPDERERTRAFHQIQARNLAALHAAGLRIALGTDSDGAGWQAHTEMADMVAAGMTPAQVLVAATRNAAEVLRITDHGTIASGKSASFVVLDANPLDDITNTRRIARVYLRGQEIDRTRLSDLFLDPGAR